MDIKTYNEKFLKEYQKLNVTKKYRRAKLQRIHENTNICPECGTPVKLDWERCEVYCPDCGLIVQASILYSGNRRIEYPYGVLL